MTDLRKFYCETNRKWFGYDRNTSPPPSSSSSSSSVFHPSADGGEESLPLCKLHTASAFVPFRPGLRASDEHPFSFNAFIYRPLLSPPSPPPPHAPFSSFLFHLHYPPSPFCVYFPLAVLSFALRPAVLPPSVPSPSLFLPLYLRWHSITVVEEQSLSLPSPILLFRLLLLPLLTRSLFAVCSSGCLIIWTIPSKLSLSFSFTLCPSVFRRIDSIFSC